MELGRKPFDKIIVKKIKSKMLTYFVVILKSYSFINIFFFHLCNILCIVCTCAYAAQSKIAIKTLVSNILATLYFYLSMYLFWCVGEFERKNDFEQTVLKIAKNKEKSVSENIFFNEKSYLKIPLLKSDLIYTINKRNVFSFILR